MAGALGELVLFRTLSNHSIMTGYNRYTYANNNPLKFTDPYGNNPLIAAAVYTVGAATKTVGLGRNWSLDHFLINTFMDAWTGGMGGAIGDFFQVGTGIFSSSNLWVNEGVRGLAHGSVGLISSGGEPSVFYAGAFSSFASSLGGLYGGVVLNSDVGGTLFSAGIGGVASEMGGGDFESTGQLPNGLHQFANLSQPIFSPLILSALVRTSVDYALNKEIAIGLSVNASYSINPKFAVGSSCKT